MHAVTADDARSRWLERLGVLVILLAGLLPRARDFFAPFDREFEGAQAAYFAIGAVNYERLGIARTGGYPVFNIDLGARDDLRRGIWDHPQSWIVYANHPPLVPLVAWAAAEVGGIGEAGPGPDWNAAWKQGLAPSGLEPWMRAPFLASSLLALLALWWAVRQAAGARRAMLALAIASATPVTIVYATLVNYENPALLCLLLAAGFFARWIRRDGQRDLLLCALAFGAGSCVTFSGLFLLPPLALLAWSRRGARPALRFASLGLLAGCAPLALHAAWSRIAQQRLGFDPPPLVARVRELWQPLIDGSHPIGEWAGLQLERIAGWFTLPIALAACAGLAIWLASALRRSKAREAATGHDRSLDLEPALLAGGALALFAFYRHTLDPQFTFLMLLVPAIAGFAALALDRVSPLLERLRAGRAPLALLTGSLALFGILQAERLRFDFRAGAGETFAGREAPPLPLPDLSGKEIATLVPAGGFAIHPACLGLNLAVSYYAWRSLWPANSPRDPMPGLVARRAGLEAAPRVLLLPKHPWPAVAASISEFEEQLVDNAPPDRESEHWRAWDLH
ncbi:MAG: glycosyltransferase family 39 protein [Planctomycetota bacterium]